MLTVVVIAMNTFIAILSTSYDDAKSESIDWIRSRQKLQAHYTNDERGLYNEPQDMVDVYEMAKESWSRFKYGMKLHVYSGYSSGDAASKRQYIHHLKVGHQVWIKMDSTPTPLKESLFFATHIAAVA